jgi:hypothetical protein
MVIEILVAQALLVLLGPAALAYLIRRRRPGIPFAKAYIHLLPGFLASAVLKLVQYRTGLGFLEFAAPLAMIVGVLVGVRRLDR